VCPVPCIACLPVAQNNPSQRWLVAGKGQPADDRYDHRGIYETVFPVHHGAGACMFCFFAVLGVGEKYPINGADRFALKHFTAQWKLITFLLVYVLVLGVGVFYFTKWYLKKQFGRYVAQLKECIRELGD
jgi:hypothetical protein